MSDGKAAGVFICFGCGRGFFGCHDAAKCSLENPMQADVRRLEYLKGLDDRRDPVIKEREACAQIVDDVYQRFLASNPYSHAVSSVIAHIAYRIRQRGEP
jgi:hypothetical protein